ncbi:Hypothetical predicted protein [Cloeon dipterum]|uniref:Uncharacterized protein n=1 Tax=Cloeon dipterum TaxID=197152 RepID=A0A8S1DUR7_9INSE|nr:Hypothetical predicted protein [Cloeon dipterum]
MAHWYYLRTGSKGPDFPVIGSKRFVKERNVMEPIFVARTQHEGNLLVGYAVNGVGHFPYKGNVVKKNEDYQVLSSRTKEERRYNFSDIKLDRLSQALQAGHMTDFFGQIPLYIGRAKVDETHLFGPVGIFLFHYFKLNLIQKNFDLLSGKA